jgi:nucleotide-binding universal stress UspA family protein
MNKRILLGVDADLSSTTQHALDVVGEFLGHAAPHIHLVLLNVIPFTQVMTAHPGMYMGQVFPLTASPSQRHHAEEVLYKARLMLQQHGIALEHTEAIVRVGAPADEIVKVARELNVSFIVVGSRGESASQQLRRFFAGSISHRVLQLASCPVMIVPSPRVARPHDLVAWYEEAIKRYLSEHTDTLSVFTPQQVARQFAPPAKNAPGRKEVAAAALALEQLASGGLLCRHQVEGELRYVND